MYVIAIGSPFDGLRLYGPFNTPEEAEASYYDMNDDFDWWIVELKSVSAVKEETK
ncbi:MAG TPA: hypothetical protein PLX97_05100 [Gemmatales bacterium]|nr:hypothetical protein [Gemmatales bacterium]